MKLATLRDGTRDGRLLVVRTGENHDAVGVPSPDAWPTLQRALDDWDAAAPALRAIAAKLASGQIDGVPIDYGRLAAPLPRAYEWIDGSAFLNHVILVRKARKAEVPPTLETDPLIYQGGSGDMLGPRDPIGVRDFAWGLDYESEVCVVLGDTPQGTTAAGAADCVRLVMLANDCTLRNLVPAELAKSFGFFQSKPATAFGPVAVTLDEVGGAWQGGRLHLALQSTWNGKRVGLCDAGPEMTFHFGQLIAHICKTRNVRAGSIVGSGTVSNKDRSRGYSCIAEKRALEILEGGEPLTPFMRFGDTIRIEMMGVDKQTVFGAIDQTVATPGSTGASD